MRDLFSCISRTPADDDRSVRSTIPQPLAIDPWIASSLFQKSIRRGDADLAERAAITLHRLRGNGIWRRFLVIAFEDIGVASVDALIKTTAACAAPSWRADVAGGDERVLCLIARLLAEAPKETDRPIT
jgi:replication-associated recombination protein RarA